MEAFPASVLVSGDEALTNAITQQFTHALKCDCHLASTWEDAENLLRANRFSVLIVDSITVHPSPDVLHRLRMGRPLLAVIGIGPDTHSALFGELPLAAYVKRPVSMPLLVRTAKHLLYQRRMAESRQQLQLHPGHLFLPAEKMLLCEASAARAELTDKESAVLLCLYQHRQEGITRARLLEEVWGYNDAIVTHTLETHLYRLRQKLRDIMEMGDIILTHQGTYRLLTG